MRLNIGVLIDRSRSRRRTTCDTLILRKLIAIERNKGSKVFARDLSIGQSLLTRLKTDNGSLISSKPEILSEVEKFYGQLYTSTQKPVESLAKKLYMLGVSLRDQMSQK
ncbi:jg8048 [Pararge aegeria aegeria]|uniref:Jg8048 protein n=1 Tax=Pararge aegeria aegeria TaxID=348720 RepID=A0A8S4QCU3_9NEOP|nr:jg8048 [Pararge aegeria aegeria]